MDSYYFDMLRTALQEERSAIVDAIVAQPDFDATAALVWLAEQYYGSAMVTFLLERKADVNARNKEGYLVLQLLLHNHAELEESLVEALIANGADVDAQDNKGVTPLMSAARKQPNLLKVMAPHSRNVDHQDYDGNSVLHHAAYGYSPKGMTALLEWKPNVNLRNKCGETPLLRAAGEHHLRPDNIALLLEARADPNIPNNKGVTAVMQLAGNIGGLPSIQLLKTRGANLTAADQDGLTALAYVKKKLDLKFLSDRAGFEATFAYLRQPAEAAALA